MTNYIFSVSDCYSVYANLKGEVVPTFYEHLESDLSLPGRNGESKILFYLCLVMYIRRVFVNRVQFIQVHDTGYLLIVKCIVDLVLG